MIYILKNSKNLFWLLPFVGGIITITSFVFPAAYFIESSPTYFNEFYRWMLDFYYSHVDNNGIHTYTIHQSTSLTGIISIISSSIIIVSNAILVINIYKYRKSILIPKKYWLNVPIVSILLTVSWMIMKEVSTILSFDHSFWNLLSPSFGIIGLYIGTSLEIMGYIIIKKQTRNN